MNSLEKLGWVNNKKRFGVRKSGESEWTEVTATDVYDAAETYAAQRTVGTRGDFPLKVEVQMEDRTVIHKLQVEAEVMVRYDAKEIK